MARYSNDPVRHVITFRVNNEEKKRLMMLVKKTNSSVSDCMRKLLQSIKEDAKRSSGMWHV